MADSGTRGEVLDLLTTGAVARRLGCSVTWVHELVREGRLTPTIRTNVGLLFSPEVVEAFEQARSDSRSDSRR